MIIEQITTNKPKLIVLIGLPGSGKSTWIKNNIDSSYVVVSSDNYIERKASEEGTNYSGAYDKHIRDASSHASSTFSEAVKGRKNIVVDMTNMGVKRRRSWLSQVGGNYYKIAVTFDVKMEVLYQRLKDRAEETGKHIPRHVIDDMLSRYESPTKEEGFDKIIQISQ
jgi:predicted kinase